MGDVHRLEDIDPDRQQNVLVDTGELLEVLACLEYCYHTYWLLKDRHNNLILARKDGQNEMATKLSAWPVPLVQHVYQYIDFHSLAVNTEQNTVRLK